MNLGRVRKGPIALAAVAALVLTVTGAASSQRNASHATTTLTILDQEVRGGQSAAIQALNAAFQKKYPDIKLDRTAKSFSDYQATVKLQMSGPNPPDVVEANNGYSAMGPLVKAGLLLPLNKYASKYGWNSRYSSGILKMNKFSADGASFGTGNLYGVPTVGEVVGVYYNKAKLKKLGLSKPTNYTQFETAVRKAKSAGETPIQFGNLDKWPGIHMFEEVWLQSVPKSYARDWIFGAGGGSKSFASAGTAQGASRLQALVKAGAFTDGYSGLGYDPSWQDFGKGNGVFLISGSWLTADLKKALGRNLGFFLLPPPNGRALATLGGEGLPWAISAKSKNADAAAKYIDFLTSNAAMQIFAKNGQVTATKANVKVPAGIDTEVFNAWKTANQKDAIVPYLDWATPTMYDTSTAAIQELLASKTAPASFVAKIQSDYSKFHSNP